MSVTAIPASLAPDHHAQFIDLLQTSLDHNAFIKLVLAKYVVVSRMHPGCRNIDLCASVSTPGRLLIVEKWESPAAQRAHFDSADMVDMAESCRGLLSGPPDIELLDGISAHDLR